MGRGYLSPEIVYKESEQKSNTAPLQETVVGIVGPSTKGPFEPTQVSSVKQLHNLFGYAELGEETDSVTQKTKKIYTKSIAAAERVLKYSKDVIFCRLPVETSDPESVGNRKNWTDFSDDANIAFKLTDTDCALQRVRIEQYRNVDDNGNVYFLYSVVGEYKDHTGSYEEVFVNKVAESEIKAAMEYTGKFEDVEVLDASLPFNTVSHVYNLSEAKAKGRNYVEDEAARFDAINRDQIEFIVPEDPTQHVDIPGLGKIAAKEETYKIYGYYGRQTPIAGETSSITVVLAEGAPASAANTPVILGVTRSRDGGSGATSISMDKSQNKDEHIAYFLYSAEVTSQPLVFFDSHTSLNVQKTVEEISQTINTMIAAHPESWGSVYTSLTITAENLPQYPDTTSTPTVAGDPVIPTADPTPSTGVFIPETVFDRDRILCKKFTASRSTATSATSACTTSSDFMRVKSEQLCDYGFGFQWILTTKPIGSVNAAKDRIDRYFNWIGKPLDITNAVLVNDIKTITVERTAFDPSVGYSAILVYSNDAWDPSSVTPGNPYITETVSGLSENNLYLNLHNRPYLSVTKNEYWPIRFDCMTKKYETYPDALDFYVGDTFEYFKNTESLDVSVLIAPYGNILEDRESTSVGKKEVYLNLNNKLLDVASSRGDCMVILDYPEAFSYSQVVDMWKSSYSATDQANACVCYPQITYRNTYLNKELVLPSSAILAGQMVYTDSVKHCWFAPAGFGDRKGIIADAISVKKQLTKEERDELYQARINPVMNFVGSGIVLWGNRTMCATNKYEADSVYVQINVRRLANFIRKVVMTNSMSILFEQNDSTTWNMWKNKIRPQLRSIQDNRGCEKFRVIMDRTTMTEEDIANGIARGAIYIWPTASIEFMEINFVMTRDSVIFDEADSEK